MNSDTKKKRQQKNQNIQVFVRVRPLNASEKAGKSYAVVDCTSSREVSVRERMGDKLTKTFAFDKVFGPNSKQVDVYRSVLNPLIDEVLAGYNCTIFAYGQTGTGKTFTMEGERSSDTSLPWSDDPLIGLIPRALSHLFDELRMLQAEFTVRVSYLELYNEELIDLLSPSVDTSKLRLFEDPTKKGTILVHGLEEIIVHSKNEVFNILERGSQKRQTAATQMNAHSSRSHTIFSITVHIKENSVDGEDLLKTGKLNLVDLAGSENIGRSGAIEKRAREAGNINQSLLTLGRVITSLVEKTPHIPYRESKLTRLLQESLGGRTKTSIIATVSPALCNVEETLSTLDYAHRAKNITNKPEINQKLSKKTLLKEYTEEIERLRKDLLAARDKNGIFLAEENYNQMVTQLELQNVEITQKISTIKALNEELEKKEHICQTLNMDLDTCTEKLRETRGKLKEVKQDRNEKAHLLDKHVETEKTLSTQAHELLNVADQSSYETYLLHDKLDRKSVVESSNKDISKNFYADFDDKTLQMSSSISSFMQNYQLFTSHIKNVIGEHSDGTILKLSTLSREISALMNAQADKLVKLENALREGTDGCLCLSCSQMESYHATADMTVHTLEKFKKEDLVNAVQGIVEINHRQQNLMERSKAALDEFAQNSETSHKRLLEVSELLRELKDNIQKTFEADIEAKETLKNQVIVLEQRKQKDASEYTELLQQSQALLKAHLSQQLEIMEKLASANSNSTGFSNETSVLLKKQLEDGIESSKQAGLTLCSKLGLCSDETKEIHDNNTSNLQQLVNNVHNASDQFNENADIEDHRITTLKTDVTKIIESEESQWLGLRSASQESHNKQTENLNNKLEDYLQRIREVTSELCQATDSQENILQRARKTISEFVQETTDDLENECLEVTDWSSKISLEVSNRCEEVEKLLFEELRTDVPTGQTPSRKEFIFPRSLVATSPHEKILERFRMVSEASLSESTEPDLDELGAIAVSDLSGSSTFSSSTVSSSSSISESVVCVSESSQFREPVSPVSTVSNMELRTSNPLDVPISIHKASSEPGLVANNKENRKKAVNSGVTKKQKDKLSSNNKAPTKKVLAQHN